MTGIPTKEEIRNMLKHGHISEAAELMIKFPELIPITIELFVSSHEEAEPEAKKSLRFYTYPRDVYLEKHVSNIETNTAKALGRVIADKKSRAAAMTAVVRALERASPRIRAGGAKSLSEGAALGANISVAIGSLEGLLGDPNASTREAASEALGHAIGNKISRTKSMTAVVRALESASPRIRAGGVEALGLAAIIDKNISDAIEPLAKLLDGADEKTAESVFSVLRDAIPNKTNNAAAMTVIVRALGSEDPKMRAGAIHALEQAHDGDFSMALHPLIELYEETDAKSHESAGFISIFGRTILNEKSTNAMWAELIASRKSTNPRIKDLATRVLKNIAFHQRVQSLILDSPEKVAIVGELLEDNDVGVKSQFAWLLADTAKKGFDISGAIKPLTGLLGDQDIHIADCAITALKNAIANEKSRAATINALVKALKNNNLAVRRKAAQMLRYATTLSGRNYDPQIEIDISVAEKPLRVLLEDPDPIIRADAADALGGIAGKGTDISDAVDPLAIRLGDVDGNVRAKAACALGNAAKSGIDTSVAIQHLANLLENPGTDELGVRAKAAWALEAAAINKKTHTAAMTALVSALRSSNPEALAAAAGALGDAADKGTDILAAIEDLAKLLGDTDENVRLTAADAFGKAIVNEKTHTVARSIVIEALKSDNSQVRSSAARALWYPASNKNGILAEIELLTKLLGDPSVEVRLNAVKALERATTNEKTSYVAMIALAKVLGDDNVEILLNAATAFDNLLKSRVDISDALPSLTKLLGNRNKQIRNTAIDIFKRAAGELDVDRILVGNSLAEYIARVSETGSEADIIAAKNYAATAYSQIASAASERTQNSVEMAGELADVRPMRPTGWNSGMLRQQAMGRTQMQEGRRVALG